MSDAVAQLSLKLRKVLERIGVSESMRKVYRDTSICREIMLTIANKMIDIPFSRYIFGSTCEGTQTPDMGSDLDVVVCNETLPVIEDVRDAPPIGRAALMVRNRHTKPCYVKLQEVRNGTPLTIDNYCIGRIGTDVQYDCDGRVCFKHVICDTPDFIEINGPAHTSSTKMGTQDSVFAFRCKTFPHFAEDSLKKFTDCGLMSSDDFEGMKAFGILLVGVGHESSPERDIEYRISFSHQERQLMLTLNSTQHQCYVMLKIIKDIISDHEDVKNSITSYHCKTCLLTVITQTGMEVWTDENLIKCIFVCLIELMNWITRGNCPNSFIPENNMFDRRELRLARERLLYYMREILKARTCLFFNIESDHIGEAMRGLDCKQVDDNRTYMMYFLLLSLCGIANHCQRDILEYCQKLPSVHLVTRYLFQQLCYISTIDTITEHTHEDTQMTVQRVELILHKVFAQHLASVAFSTEDPMIHYRLLTASDYHLRRGMNGDVMSCRLLEATIVYRKGNLKSCCRLLEHMHRKLMQGAIDIVCRCYNHWYTLNDDLERNISSGYTNQHNIMESSVAMCMMFLPSQLELTPNALQYEMYRSVGTPPGSRHELFNKWFDWAVVDSKVYLYFMQYLVYTDMNKPVAKQIAIDQIWKMVLQNENLGHRETAFNLLGWIYVQEEQILLAARCFWHSLRMQPNHNAAKWHLGVLFWRQTSR